jgi:hypothetical protein
MILYQYNFSSTSLARQTLMNGPEEVIFSIEGFGLRRACCD